jgi:hypothetical protein
MAVSISLWKHPRRQGGKPRGFVLLVKAVIDGPWLAFRWQVPAPWSDVAALILADAAQGGSTEGSGTVWEAKMLDETRVKQIMLDAILRHKEASTMSLRTAGAVVNAIYDALEKANVLAKIEKRHSPEKSG